MTRFYKVAKFGPLMRYNSETLLRFLALRHASVADDAVIVVVRTDAKLRSTWRVKSVNNTSGDVHVEAQLGDGTPCEVTAARNEILVPNSPFHNTEIDEGTFALCRLPAMRIFFSHYEKIISRRPHTGFRHAEQFMMDHLRESNITIRFPCGASRDDILDLVRECGKRSQTANRSSGAGVHRPSP